MSRAIPPVRNVSANLRNRLISAAAGASSGGHLFSRAVSAAAATITSPTSDPGSSGLTNLGANNGFITSTTATAVIGSKSVVVASATGIAKGQPFVEMAATVSKPTYIPSGAIVIDVQGTTITLDKAALASGSGIAVRTIHDGLKFTGGIGSNYGSGNILVFSHSTGATGANRGSPAVNVVETSTDAANLSIAAIGLQFKFYNNGLASPRYRVAIDGIYQTANPVAFGNTLAGDNNWLCMQFAVAGSHTVRIEYSGLVLMTGLWVRTGATLWKPPQRPVIGFNGDSWFDGGSAGSWAGRNPPNQISEILGCEPMMLSQGGTGYSNKGAGNANMTFADPIRLNDLVDLRSLDALIIFGSVNDGATDVTTAALSTYQQARALCPKIPISIFGCATTGVYSAGSATTQEGYHTAAFTSFADMSSWYHPITTNPSGALINANNLATYVDAGTDNNHLTDIAGSEMLSRWMATQIHRDWINWNV